MIKFNCKIISLIFLSFAFSAFCSNLSDNSNFLPSEQPVQTDPLESFPVLTIPLANFHNQEYSGQLLIGSDGRPFKLNFDTGFPWIWVSPEDANISNPDSKPTLQCNFSSTCQIMSGPESMVKEEVMYFPSSETIKGYLATDNVAFHGIKSRVNQTLLLSKSTDSIQSEHYDGVCGLSLMNDRGSPNLIDTLHAAKIIKKKVFGLYLSDNPEAYGESSSEITFGGINPNYEKVDFIDVKVQSDSVYWQVSLDNIFLGTLNTFSTIPSIKASNAVIASGISKILMMSDDLMAFKNALQTSYGIFCRYNEYKEVTCTCNNGDIRGYPNITFQLNSKMLSIPPSLYLEVNEKDCTLLIDGTLENSNTYFKPQDSEEASKDAPEGHKALEKGTYMVLGGVFLRNFYTVFDSEEKKMSFTPAIRPPKSMITTLEVIYMIFGAFILVMFVVFVGCFIQICLTKKNPTMEKNGLDKTLIERKTTLSQFGQGLESN